MVRDTVLSLGSNLGDRALNIKRAAEEIGKAFSADVARSSVYETPPLYCDGPQMFYNCCLCVKTEMEPRSILEKCMEIENLLGRVRKGVKLYEPRLIDIDIIFIGDLIVTDDDLTVPHPIMQDRLFVLKPLSEIMPDFVHPAIGLTVRDLLEDTEDASAVRKIKDFWG